MKIDEVRQYPTRYRVHQYAKAAISSDCSLLAAEVFSDEYKGEMQLLVSEDRPPCCCCADETVYFCFMTEMECRTFICWTWEVGR